MYVPNGSRLVYHAEIARNFVMDAINLPDILQHIASDLHNNDGVEIEDVTSIPPPGGVGKDIVTFHLFMQNSVDHANENDVKAIVDHYFWQEAGALPIASSITSVQLPHGTPENTGAPDPTPPSGGGDPSSWLDQLLGKLKAASVGAVVGLGLGVGLVVILLARASK